MEYGKVIGFDITHVNPKDKGQPAPIFERIDPYTDEILPGAVCPYYDWVNENFDPTEAESEGWFEPFTPEDGRPIYPGRCEYCSGPLLPGLADHDCPPMA
ncbi:MAG: hypothetical protein V3W19_14990 [Desulfatiglandales bacterium]